jgi:hypothetical protein
MNNKIWFLLLTPLSPASLRDEAKHIIFLIKKATSKTRNGFFDFMLLIIKEL